MQQLHYLRRVKNVIVIKFVIMYPNVLNDVLAYLVDIYYILLAVNSFV